MRKTAVVWIAAVAAFYLPNNLFGAEIGATQARIRDVQAEAEEPSPWRLFAGFSAGHGWVSGDEFREAPGGRQIALGLLGSYRADRWGIDAGVGWRQSLLSGVDDQGRSIDIRTRSGFAELFPNLRVGSRWQVGPLAMLGYGTDTGEGPVVLNSSSVTPWVGARALYEFPTRPLLVRFTAQMMTDLALDQRQTWTGMAGVQIGLPIHASRTQSVETHDEVRLTQAAPGPAPAPAHEVRIVLDSQRVFSPRIRRR